MNHTTFNLIHYSYKITENKNKVFYNSKDDFVIDYKVNCLLIRTNFE